MNSPECLNKARPGRREEEDVDRQSASGSEIYLVTGMRTMTL